MLRIQKEKADIRRAIYLRAVGRLDQLAHEQPRAVRPPPRR